MKNDIRLFNYSIQLLHFTLAGFVHIAHSTGDNILSEPTLTISYQIISPPENEPIRWGDIICVQANISSTLGSQPKNGMYAFSWQCSHPELCSVLGKKRKIVDLDHEGKASVNISMEMTFIGYTQLQLEQSEAILQDYTLPIATKSTAPLRLSILRSQDKIKLTYVFTGFIIIFVVVNTFMMGTQLHWEIIVETVKKPVGPVIGFLCQFGLMPMIAYVWARLILNGYPSLQFGYFAAGCAPGGGASNFWTILLDGNLDLSITMTFFSNLAAFGMMPLWLYTVGGTFFDVHLVLPFANIAASLGALTVPAALGMLLARCKPSIVPHFRRAVKWFILSVLAFIIAFSCYVNAYIFSLMRWYTLVAGLALPWSGYLISYIIARLVARRTHRDSRTIAIETGIQNGSIAILLCQMSLEPPMSDLTLVMPVCVLMFTGAPMWCWLLVRTVRRRCFGYVDPDLLHEKKCMVPENEDENESRMVKTSISDLQTGDKCDSEMAKLHGPDPEGTAAKLTNV